MYLFFYLGQVFLQYNCLTLLCNLTSFFLKKVFFLYEIFFYKSLLGKIDYVESSKVFRSSLSLKLCTSFHNLAHMEVHKTELTMKVPRLNFTNTGINTDALSLTKLGLIDQNCFYQKCLTAFHSSRQNRHSPHFSKTLSGYQPRSPIAYIN